MAHSTIVIAIVISLTVATTLESVGVSILDLPTTVIASEIGTSS